MKILDVIPVNFDIISEDMKKYLEEPLHQNGYANPTVVVHQRLYEGKPSIESAYDEVLNTRYVYRTIEQNLTEGFGASFINCFGDPGVIAARCKADFLVFGGFEPAVLFALGLADRVGIITVLDNVQPMLWEHVHNAKLENRVVSIRNVNMPVLGLEDHSQLIEHLTNQAFEAIKSDGAEAFVLGCTGMLSVAQAVESNLARAGYTVPVIEPGQAAMAMCEMIGKLGYTHSRLAFPKEMKA